MDNHQWQSLTLGQILDRTVAAHADRDAIIYPDRSFRLTYGAFAEVVNQLAKGLMAMGIKKGQKVAVWATNIPYWVALQFAAAKIGAVLLTVNTNYNSTELAWLLEQSDTETLFIMDGDKDTDFIQTVYDLLPELKTRARGQMTSPRFPHLKRVCFLGQEKHRGMYSLPEIMALAPLTSDAEYAARQAELDVHDVANILYTSGTTGIPKGVMLTHHSVGNNGWWVGENQRFSEHDRVCLPIPLFDCFGCVLGVLAAVSHGTAMVILENFDPVQVMASVAQERCTALYGVPAMFMAVLEDPLFNKFDFSSLRTGVMAGSACPVPVMRQVIDRMHMHAITICYGLTENAAVMTQTRPEDSLQHRTETVGRAMPRIEVKIVDPHTGRRMAAGEQGEVCCRGHSVMQGYYKMPAATAAAIDADGWLHSGDLGVLDADGYLAIIGRHHDRITRGGENIRSREIEALLLGMQGIMDVQVVGVPSRKYGQEVGAFIIRQKGVDLTAGDVQDFCRGQIARHKIPAYVTFVNSFPLTASGKVQKYRLQKQSADLLAESDVG